MDEKRRKRKNLAIILQVFSLLSGNTIRRGTRLTFQQSSDEGSSVGRVAEVRISLKKSLQGKERERASVTMERENPNWRNSIENVRRER